MLENQIRKSQLNQRLLQRKTEESGLVEALQKSEQELADIEAKIIKGKENEAKMQAQKEEWREKTQENVKKLEQANIHYNKMQSRLESLKNIAERYEGYGNSIRRIMEKETESGIHGVVADLIQVKKQYETAIETALSSNVQNIVTEDEENRKADDPVFKGKPLWPCDVFTVD